MQEDEVSIVKVMRKPRKCVNCGGRVVPILYGMPSPI
jgi:hypothetical protein